MNLQHIKQTVEVAKAGSLSKASEVLLTATPNISRAIKELESDLGITIFHRTAKGMELTADGEQFISFAKSILAQIDHVEKFYKNGAPQKQTFSISVPRASYISEAFSNLSLSLTDDNAEIFYKETNSQRAIHNMTEHDYKLGIIRYAENYDMYFKSLLEEKGFDFEVVAEFTYHIIASKASPLAGKDELFFSDLANLIEIAHADPYVPSLPVSKVIKEELSDSITRRIFVFERASQFELLSKNPDTFMWVSPIPQSLLERYSLVQKPCEDSKKIYRDLLIHKKGYKLTELDKRFVQELYSARDRMLSALCVHSDKH